MLNENRDETLGGVIANLFGTVSAAAMATRNAATLINKVVGHGHTISDGTGMSLEIWNTQQKMKYEDENEELLLELEKKRAARMAARTKLKLPPSSTEESKK